MSSEQGGRSVGLVTTPLLDLTIEEGGQLLPSLRADLLLPMGAPQLALARYLHRVIDTMGVTCEDCLHCLTSTRIVEIDRLWSVAGSSASLLVELDTLASVAGDSASWLLSPDLRQWIGELLTTRDVAVWLGRGREAQPPVAPETNPELMAIWQCLRGPRTVAEVLRHAPAVVLIDPEGQHATAVLRWLAARLAAIQLEGAVQQLVEPALAWPGPLLLPLLVELRHFAHTLAIPPPDESPLMNYLVHQLGAPHHAALEGFFRWRLAGDGVLLLLDGLDDIADAQRQGWAVQAMSYFQRCFPQARMVLTSRTMTQGTVLRAQLDVLCTTILA